MGLSQLSPTGPPVPMQSTTLSVDALGRLICNTWDEATVNGGPPFTVVVIGSGMYGAYLAAKVIEQHPTARVLVLEAGPFLVTEHVQNLGNIGLNIPAPIDPASDPGIAREVVRGIPWRGNVNFPGLAYCTGGKSLYWGGWCPRLTPDDLDAWPDAVSSYLETHYEDVERETGVLPADDFISGSLLDELRARTMTAAATVGGFDSTLNDGAVQPAPIAVQSAGPASGLFPFAKFSSLPLLIAAIRTDVNRSNGSDAARLLFLVPRAHVIRIEHENGTATGLTLDVNGHRVSYPLALGARVVLAASTIESTRLVLESLPVPLAGRNLAAHVRSDFTVRVHRAVLGGIAQRVQTAAPLVRGRATHGCFHLQLTASDSTDGSDALLYQMVPDLDLLDQQLARTDPDWVTITIRGIGQMTGDKDTPAPNTGGSWIDLSPFETDEFGAPRAYIRLVTRPDDIDTWQAMDQATMDLAAAIAGTPADIQNRYDGNWQTAPFPADRPFPSWHLDLGSTHHEAGTLWMGDDPNHSVSDTDGLLCGTTNIYTCDQAAFPTVGSVNPVLTGLTLAHKMAAHLA